MEAQQNAAVVAALEAQQNLAAVAAQQSAAVAVAAAQQVQQHVAASIAPAGLTPHVVPPVRQVSSMAPASSSSSTASPLAGVAVSTAAADSAKPVELPPEPEEPEVPHCHLHRKVNKACKFCKAHNEYLDRKNKKIEERKKAAIEKLKVCSSVNPIKVVDTEDVMPLPNLAQFPSYMLERLQKNDYYMSTISQFRFEEVTKLLLECDTCDTEVRDQNSLALEPSVFICSVYRLMTLQLTEGQLQNLLNSRSCWIRIAGYLCIRLGAHHERYWDLLHVALLDDEEFVPFPGRESEKSSVGQFVELLLAKDKFCNMTLPRIPTAARKQISKRLVLYGQFRQRYAANLECIARYQKAEEDVEVCSIDGDWSKAKTVGSTSSGRRCVTTKVRYAGGYEDNISLGMVIMPQARSDRQAWDVEDLTRVRGRSSQELMDELMQQQRNAAVASGKDYCRNSGQITMRVGGVPFVAGQKRKEVEKDSESDEESRFVKKKGPSLDHQAKMAAIESKYCAKVSSSQGGKSREWEGPERMRLG